MAGSLWQVDHVVPVSEGGGQCGLQNLRTLCSPCHAEVTRLQAGTRARARRGRSAEGVEDRAQHVAGRGAPKGQLVTIDSDDEPLLRTPLARGRRGRRVIPERTPSPVHRRKPGGLRVRCGVLVESAKILRERVVAAETCTPTPPHSAKASDEGAACAAPPVWAKRWKSQSLRQQLWPAPASLWTRSRGRGLLQELAAPPAHVGLPGCRACPGGSQSSRARSRSRSGSRAGHRSAVVADEDPLVPSPPSPRHQGWQGGCLRSQPSSQSPGGRGLCSGSAEKAALARHPCATELCEAELLAARGSLCGVATVSGDEKRWRGALPVQPVTAAVAAAVAARPSAASAPCWGLGHLRGPNVASIDLC